MRFAFAPDDADSRPLYLIEAADAAAFVAARSAAEAAWLGAAGFAGRLGQIVVLPRVMFDHPDGVSLDDRSPLDIASALGKPVALADLMGDLVDVIQGRPALYFHPSGQRVVTPRAIQRSGGGAVEKYL
jgi:hypothetical protein